MTLATQDSLNRWAQKIVPQISGVDDPALARTLEDLVTTTTIDDCAKNRDGGRNVPTTTTTTTTRRGGRAKGKTTECVERMNVREVTTMLRRQTSKVDGSVFERSRTTSVGYGSARCGPR